MDFMTYFNTRFFITGKFVFFSFLSIMLTACTVSQSRSDVHAFKLTRDEFILPANTQAFADCLLDGFDQITSMTSKSSRQQRRSDSYRVERLVRGKIIIVSVDIFPNGRVALYENTTAYESNISEEKETFSKCLNHHRK